MYCFIMAKKTSYLTFKNIYYKTCCDCLMIIFSQISNISYSLGHKICIQFVSLALQLTCFKTQAYAKHFTPIGDHLRGCLSHQGSVLMLHIFSFPPMALPRTYKLMMSKTLLPAQYIHMQLSPGYIHPDSLQMHLQLNLPISLLKGALLLLYVYLTQKPKSHSRFIILIVQNSLTPIHPTSP